MALRGKVLRIIGVTTVGLRSLSSRIIEYNGKPTEDITERKRMEDALRESEEFFRSIFDNAPMGVALVDKDGYVLAANEADCRFLGYSRDELVGTHFRTFTYSEDLNTDSKLYDSLIRGERASYVIDKRYVRKDGKIVWGRLSASLIRDAEGRPGYAVILCEDITDRKRMQPALQERVKELGCLYGIVRSIERLGSNLDAIMGEVVSIIPPAYQYPDITCARIVLDKRVFESAKFKESRWSQSADIKVLGNIAGTVEIYYLEEKPTSFEGPFLKEERALIDAIAERLGRVVERVRTESALQENEKLFRHISSAISDITYSCEKPPDGAYSISWMMGAVEHITGYSMEEIKAQGCWRFLVVDEDLALFEKNVTGLAPGSSGFCELRLRHKSGDTVWVDSSAECVTEPENPELLRLYGGIVDITERKRAERALRESEELYRHLIERQGEGLAILDLEERFTFCNPRGDEIFGVSPGGMVSRTTREFTTNETFEFIKKQTEKRLAGEKDTYELEILRPDGDKRHLLVTAAPWMDKGDHVIGSVAIFRDETDRKRAEEEIRKLNQFLASIIDNTNVWLDVLDENANVVIWNKAAEAISGYSREEVAGHGKIWEWLYPDEEYRRQLTDLVAEVVQRGRVEEDFETRIRRKDGEIRIISWNERNLLDEHGKAIGSIALGRDVTERKRMEEKLKEYSEHLEQLVEERTKKLQDAERLATIGQVAAMVGHDLRNPLQVLTNTLYLLGEGFKAQSSSQMAELLEKKRPMLLETMEEQVGYMNKIVSDLQDYARPLKPELAPTNLRRLMDEILSAADVPESVDVSIEIEENVRELTVDHSLMKRTITNLVTNAVQAMPDGGRLTIQALKADRIALISIQDTGAGVPKENLDKVFTPMFSTKAKGQGFGLAACKRIVEAHGGTIWFESAVGKGTTVFIKIPITDEVG